MDAAPLLTPERVLRRLQWQVVRRLDGRLQGDYRTLLRGNGTDFLDLRSYEWGDDVRHIDWNVTARMDELFVREFMEDRELTAWLLLDRSRSMAFGAVERTKERVLCELAATFGQLLVRGGNRVGAIIYDGKDVWTIPPRQGRHQVLTLVRELLRPVRGGSVTDLSKLLDTAARVVRRRSLVVLISDFISEPGWERPLLRLTERARGRRRPAGRSPRVRAPRRRAVVRARTRRRASNCSSIRAILSSAGASWPWREEQDEAIRHGVAQARVVLHVVSTEDDLVSAFVRMAESGRRRRR